MKARLACVEGPVWEFWQTLVSLDMRLMHGPGNGSGSTMTDSLCPAH